jgi:lysozyme
MLASPALYDFLRWWEGIPGGRPALNAYRDGAGVWTIGYGSTLGVKAGDTITEAEAERRLAVEVDAVAIAVTYLVQVPLEQRRFDALVSFAYNCGTDIDADNKPEGLGDSRLLALVNSRQFDLAAAQFPLWVWSGGVRSRGLERRRIAEMAIFMHGDYRMRP